MADWRRVLGTSCEGSAVAWRLLARTRLELEGLGWELSRRRGACGRMAATRRLRREQGGIGGLPCAVATSHSSVKLLCSSTGNECACRDVYDERMLEMTGVG